MMVKRKQKTRVEQRARKDNCAAKKGENRKEIVRKQNVRYDIIIRERKWDTKGKIIVKN